eukprot:m.32899 g.32899  ORF g.32899 m.32899 type:complete len:502 (-) comp5047_c0_seq1:38-1543(-)
MPKKRDDKKNLSEASREARRRLCNLREHLLLLPSGKEKLDAFLALRPPPEGVHVFAEGRARVPASRETKDYYGALERGVRSLLHGQLEKGSSFFCCRGRATRDDEPALAEGCARSHSKCCVGPDPSIAFDTYHPRKQHERRERHGEAPFSAVVPSATSGLGVDVAARKLGQSSPNSVLDWAAPTPESLVDDFQPGPRSNQPDPNLPALPVGLVDFVEGQSCTFPMEHGAHSASDDITPTKSTTLMRLPTRANKRVSVEDSTPPVEQKSLKQKRLKFTPLRNKLSLACPPTLPSLPRVPLPLHTAKCCQPNSPVTKWKKELFLDSTTSPMPPPGMTSPSLVAGAPNAESLLDRDTKRFVTLLRSTLDGVLDCDATSQLLNMSKHRIDNVVNVLEGLGLIEKRSESVVRLKHDAAIDYPENEADDYRFDFKPGEGISDLFGPVDMEGWDLVDKYRSDFESVGSISGLFEPVDMVGSDIVSRSMPPESLLSPLQLLQLKLNGLL